MPRGVYPRTPEHSANISAAKKGRTYEEIYGDRAEEQRAKRRHPVSEQARANIGEAQNRSEVKMKKSVGQKGRKHNMTPEGHRRLCESKKGDKNPAKRPEVRKKNGRAHLLENLSEETKAKMRKPHPSIRGENNPAKHPEVRIKIRTKNIERWQDPEYKERQLKAMMKAFHVKPNKLEKFFEKLFRQLSPDEWKYVGDGQFILGGKCPDFVNINGQKKIVELFGDYWHGEKFTGRTKEEEEKQRIDHFAKHGYQTLVIWEHELEDIDILTDRILKFSEVENLIYI